MKNERNVVKQGCADTGTFISILFYAYGAYLAILILYGIWILFQPGTLFEFTHDSGLSSIILQSGPHYELVFPYTGVTEQGLNHAKAIYLIYFWCKITGKACMMLVLYNLHSVFKRIQNNGTPFISNNVSSIRNIGILLVAYSWLPSLIYFNIFGIANYFEGKTIGSLNYWMWLIIGIIIVSLSKIFEYGCSLQQESDDTL